MGGKTEDKKAHGHYRNEAEEFGNVKHEQDLEDSERDGSNPDARADSRQALSNPDSAGYFERSANTLGGPLRLEEDFDPSPGRDLRDHAKGVNAVDIDGYEQAYNMYSIPYGMTMKALGRTKDLSTAGAPLTPADFKKKQPKLAARFAGLTTGEGGSGKASFDQWSRVQKEMRTNVGVTNAAQIKLQSAIYGFEEAHAMIQQRQLAAKKAKDMTELEEINETADLFIVADGDAAKYDQLTKDIKRIDELSAKWKDNEFDMAVKKANTALDGAVMEVHARQMGNKGDSVDARRFASDFNAAMGGGSEGELAMYAAEAYQELSVHGDNASDVRTRMVDGPWKKVYNWMNNYPAAIKDTLAGRDAKALADNLQEVREEREFLNGSLPEWKERAAEWSHFFKRPLV